VALDFSGLQTELFARGFTDLNDGGAGVVRAKRWLNDAAHEIDDMNDWPYLNTTLTGTAPLTIADLGTIETVGVAGSYNLAPRDRRDLRRNCGDLATTGTAWAYYIVGGTTINVYPVQAGLSLTVDYWKVPVDMVANGDVPAMPDRYRMAIVDLAVERAARDRGDEAGAQAARAQGLSRLQMMEQRLMSLQHQAPQDFVEAIGDDC
jgi:hypothetical protein